MIPITILQTINVETVIPFPGSDAFSPKWRKSWITALPSIYDFTFGGEATVE